MNGTFASGKGEIPLGILIHQHNVVSDSAKQTPATKPT
jgi:hypothetical protein